MPCKKEKAASAPLFLFFCLLWFIRKAVPSLTLGLHTGLSGKLQLVQGPCHRLHAVLNIYSSVTSCIVPSTCRKPKPQSKQSPDVIHVPYCHYLCWLKCKRRSREVVLFALKWCPLRFLFSLRGLDFLSAQRSGLGAVEWRALLWPWTVKKGTTGTCFL